mmetsp:Transcript_37324/g.69524  ORF Transcript_37324/g.69524 Transcript_37324/m.69524 type:complete len:856 (+) Transcript_37324:176-2743(+)
MKNTWLRAEEQTVVKPSPALQGCKQMKLRDRAPVVMTPAQTRPVSVIVPPRDQRQRPETSPACPGHSFAIRKDMISETIRSTYRDSASTDRSPFWINGDSRTKRKLKRANKLLQGVLKSCTAHDGVPKPGNHIVRKLEKTLHPTLKRAQSVPRFSFIDEDFITFGTFDVELRPGWDDSLLISADEKIAEERRQRVKIMKEKLLEMNAITNAVKEVITTYSRSNVEYIKDNMRFTVPVYLNNHEIHAWKVLSNLLYTYGRSFQLMHMEEISDICGLDDRKENPKIDLRRFRFQHAEIFHFICYCNLLLGGTKSFVSARFMLLRDLEMLMGLIQHISPLNIPIENLRAASAFRLREAKHMKQLATNTYLGSQHPSQLNSASTSSKMTGRASMRQPPTTQSWTKTSDSSMQHQSPWDDNVSWASACPSKLTMFTMESGVSQSCTTVKTAHTSVFNTLPQKLSSWTLSFSLLARITLVSAGRTPHRELLETARNKAFPEDSRLQSLLVKVEEVKVAQADITKIVASSQISFSRLPPPEAPAPDLSPCGLFASTEKPSNSLPRQRRQSLNKQILLKKDTGKNKIGELPTQVEVPSRQSLVEERRGTASQTSNKVLAAVRTSNLSLNFRNAESLMFALRKKNNGQIDSMLEELSDEDDDDFSEDDEDEDDEDLGGLPGGDGQEVGNFIERMALERLQSVGEITDDNESSPLKTPASPEKFHLYADMMTEAESVEMLKKGSANQRLVVMDALSAKKDRMLERGRWKETKLDEKKQFEKNLEKNKEYVDEVIRMFNLRAQLEDSKPKTNDFSIRWKEVMEKNRSGLRNESMKQNNLGSPEKKILSMLKHREIKQDRTSLRSLE